MNWLTHEFPTGKRICIHVQVWPVPVPVTGFSLNLNISHTPIYNIYIADICSPVRMDICAHTNIAAMTEMELIMVGVSAAPWPGPSQSHFQPKIQNPKSKSAALSGLENLSFRDWR